MFATQIKMFRHYFSAFGGGCFCLMYVFIGLLSISLIDLLMRIVPLIQFAGIR